MADRIEHFTVTAVAGTSAAAPREIPIGFAPGEVERIDVVIPDGHAGLTGIALALAHQPIIPKGGGKFFVGNDDVIPLPLEDLPNSGAWSAFVYNVDIFDHAFYLRVLVREIGRGPLIVEPESPGVSVTGEDQGVPPDATPPPDETPPPEDVPPPDETPPPEDVPPPDETPPPEDSEPPPEDVAPDASLDSGLPPEPADVAPAPAPPPAPAPIFYALPADYKPLDSLPSTPANLGMLIGHVLGTKVVGSGSNANGSFWTLRFFSDLGATYDWNYYLSGAKARQWVGPFNRRTPGAAG